MSSRKLPFPVYPTYVSKHGPKYQLQPQIAGITAKQGFTLAARLGGFGAAAVVGLLFFGSGIPRVQNDILKKIPGMAGFYDKSVHPADNVGAVLFAT